MPEPLGDLVVVLAPATWTWAWAWASALGAGRRVAHVGVGSEVLNSDQIHLVVRNDRGRFVYHAGCVWTATRWRDS